MILFLYRETARENGMRSCAEDKKQLLFGELAHFIADLPERKGALISVLHKAQSIFGYLPQEVQEFVAAQLKIPVSKVYGVVEFYAFFTMTPKGEHPISICLGTACFIKGARDVLDELKQVLSIDVGEVTQDGKFSIDTLRCVGTCAMAPVIMIDDKVYGNVAPKNIKKIIREFE
jgi:NADP-reducing hydrogenase subunit HndA